MQNQTLRPDTGQSDQRGPVLAAVIHENGGWRVESDLDLPSRLTADVGDTSRVATALRAYLEALDVEVVEVTVGTLRDYVVAYGPAVRRDVLVTATYRDNRWWDLAYYNAAEAIADEHELPEALTRDEDDADGIKAHLVTLLRDHGLAIGEVVIQDGGVTVYGPAEAEPVDEHEGDPIAAIDAAIIAETGDAGERPPASDEWADYDQAEIQAVRAQVKAEDAEPVDDSVPTCLRGPWMPVLTDEDLADHYASLADVPDGKTPAISVVRRGALEADEIGTADVLYVCFATDLDDLDPGDTIQLRWEQAQHVAAAVNAYITNATASAVDDAERGRELDTLRRLTAQQREQLAEYRRTAANPGMWAEPVTLPAWLVPVGCQIRVNGEWTKVTQTVSGAGLVELHTADGAAHTMSTEHHLPVRVPIAVDQLRLDQFHADLLRLDQLVIDQAAQIDLLRARLAGETAEHPFEPGEDGICRTCWSDEDGAPGLHCDACASLGYRGGRCDQHPEAGADR